MKLNVVDEVCSYAENALDLPFTIYADLIADAETDGACLRRDPAPAAEKRFTDGTRLVSWVLSFYARCKDANDALSYAKDITDALDGAAILSGDANIECEALTLPQFIETDAKGFTTYCASVKCSYLEEV